MKIFEGEGWERDPPRKSTRPQLRSTSVAPPIFTYFGGVAMTRCEPTGQNGGGVPRSAGPEPEQDRGDRAPRRGVSTQEIMVALDAGNIVRDLEGLPRCSTAIGRPQWVIYRSRTRSGWPHSRWASWGAGLSRPPSRAWRPRHHVHASVGRQPQGLQSRCQSGSAEALSVAQATCSRVTSRQEGSPLGLPGRRDGLAA